MTIGLQQINYRQINSFDKLPIIRDIAVGALYIRFKELVYMVIKRGK